MLEPWLPELRVLLFEGRLGALRGAGAVLRGLAAGADCRVEVRGGIA